MATTATDIRNSIVGEIVTIPLNKLAESDENVRSNYDPNGIASLASSIKAVGLEQNLVVQKTKNGSYGVIAGGRRLAALKLLVKQKQLSKDAPIPCRVLAEDESATTASLTENIHREGMSAADEFDAFNRLAGEGKSAEEIATIFGVNTTHVEKRLKLARVARELFDAFRDGKMSLDTLKAFTLTDDHEAQIKAYEQYGNSHWQIKRALEGEMVKGTDTRVKLVGLDAYTAAGGVSIRDLFATEEGEGVLLTNVALLDELVKKRTDEEKKRLAALGFKWVEYVDSDKFYSFKYERFVKPKPAELTEKLAAEVDQLEKIVSDFEDSDDGGEQPDSLVEKYNDARERLQQIEEEQDEIYDPVAMKHGGIIFCLDRNDGLRHRGVLIRKEDLKAYEAEVNGEQPTEAGQGSTGASEPDAEPEPETAEYSGALLEDITKQKTAILAISLAQNPDLALVVATAKLVRSALYRWGTHDCSLGIGFTKGSHEEGKALAELETIANDFGSILPGKGSDVFQFLLTQPKETVEKMFALCVGLSIDSVLPKGMKPGPKFDDANEIGVALKVDPADWFEADEAMFSRMSKASMFKAMAEAGLEVTDEVSKLKKGDLAKHVAEAIKGKRWVPGPLQVRETKKPAKGDKWDERQFGARGDDGKPVDLGDEDEEEFVDEEELEYA